MKRRIFLSSLILAIVCSSLTGGAATYAFVSALFGNSVSIPFAIVSGALGATAMFSFAVANIFGLDLHGPRWISKSMGQLWSQPQ